MKERVQSGSMAAEHGAPMLLIHGGAWAIPDEECPAYETGMARVVQLGKSMLTKGNHALDVVTEVVAAMEEDGAFDAGRGSVLTENGEIRMDAGLMRGSDQAYGAVARVQGIRNPIRMARHLLEGDGTVRMASGDGVRKMALQAGLECTESRWHESDRERERHARIAREQARYHVSATFSDEQGHPRGTVGCIARDGRGHLAAATSTGGTPFRPEVRIGDSPLPGCGFFADATAAASATGWGEAIAGSVLCGRTCFDVAADLSTDQAARKQISGMLARYRDPRGNGATGGVIVLSARGDAGWAWSTPRMARAGWHPGIEPWSGVYSGLEPGPGHR